MLAGASCGARTGLEVPVPCIALAPEGPPLRVELDTERRLGPVDVVILLDESQSAGYYFRALQATLRSRIVPALGALDGDVQLSLALFNDFPEGDCGEPANLPFRMRTPIGSSIEAVDRALAAAFPYGGGTDSASNVEGLYQLATGEGVGSWVRPATGCPPGTEGYACFRPEALPLILHFADSPFHNGPGGSHPYSDPAACPVVAPYAHTYEEAVEALRWVHARVLTFYPRGVTSEAIADFERLARDTESLRSDGSPLVFAMANEPRLDPVVPEAIVGISDALPVDVGAFIVDGDPTDGVDARDLVSAVLASRAEPPSGVRAIDREGGRFLGAVGDVRLHFELELRADAGVPPGRYRVTIVFRAEGRGEIGRRSLDVVVEGSDVRCGR